MVKNGVALNWGGFDRALVNASRKLSDTRPLMASVGEALVSGTIRRFAAEKAPDGSAWEKSKRAAEENGQTLTDTGRLRKSIDFAATPDKVMVGSNLPYARIHQLGGTIRPKKGKALKFRGRNGKDVIVSRVNMPARPYLGVSKADMDEVRALLQSFLAGAFK